MAANYEAGMRGLDAWTYQRSSWGQYGDSALQGAVTGIGALAGPTVAGLAAGGYRAVSDAASGKGISVSRAATEGIVTSIAGKLANSVLPNIAGRLPNVGTTAFFTGAHTQLEIARSVVETSVSSSINKAVQSVVNTVGSTVNRIVSSVGSALKFGF